MKKSRYFIKLRSEFESSPFQERFLEELEAHAEDLIEDQAVPKKSVDASFLQKCFGEPNEVKKKFIEITDPWQKWWERLEAFGYGTLLIIWMSASDTMNVILNYPQISIQSLLTIIFLLIPYPFIWKKILSKKDNLNSNPGLLAWVTAPNIIFLGLSWINFSLNLGNNSSINTEFYLKMTGISIALGLVSFALFAKQRNSTYQRLLLSAILSINTIFLASGLYQIYQFWSNIEDIAILYLLYNSGLILLITAVISIWLLKNKKKEKVPKKNTKKILKFITFFIFFYILSHTILRVSIPYLDFTFYEWADTTWWRLLFFPINYLETILLFFLPSNISSSIKWAHFFQIFIMSFILMVGLSYQLMKKRFSYIASSGIIYALGLFLVAGMYQENPDLSIHVPYIMVSEVIEKNQYGPFHGAVHYLENKYRNGSGYEIAVDGNQFGIKQFGQANLQNNSIDYPFVSSGPFFSLNTNGMSLNEIQEGELDYDFVNPKTMEQEIIDAVMNDSEIYFSPLNPWDWPESLECSGSEQAQFSGYCSALIYKGIVLMELNHDQFELFDLELSENKNHLMVVIEVDSVDYAVYLLDLSGIK